MSAYGADGDLIFEVGQRRAASVRTQSFVAPADHIIVDAPNARVAVLGLSNMGGQRAVALSVVLPRLGHGLHIRGFDVAVPVDLIRPWLSTNEMLPQPIDLGFALRGAGEPWFLFDGPGEEQRANPSSMLNASAEGADHPLGIVLRTPRPNLREILLSAWLTWLLILGPALAFIGAVVLRSRFRWVRLERQVAEGETSVALNVAALDLAKIGVVHWDLSAAKIRFSETWRQLLGYAGDEFCEEITEWLDRIHPEDRVRCTKAYQALLDGEQQAFAHEVRLLCRAGAYDGFFERGVRQPNAGAILVTLERVQPSAFGPGRELSGDSLGVKANFDAW
jgi:PAS domain-containing protein